MITGYYIGDDINNDVSKYIVIEISV